MSSLFLPQSSRHTGAIICMLQKILATSRRLEDSMCIASRDEKCRYPHPWKHWKSASTPRSAVEKDRQIDGLAVAQPALSCFLYEMCTALEWCITPTQSGDLLYQPIQIHPVNSCIFYPPMGFGSCWSCLSRPSSESSMAPRSKRRLVCCITGQRPQRRQVINFILNIPGIPAYCSSDQTLYMSSFLSIGILSAKNWHVLKDVLQGRGHIRLRGAWPSWAMDSHGRWRRVAGGWASLPAMVAAPPQGAGSTGSEHTSLHEAKETTQNWW